MISWTFSVEPIWSKTASTHEYFSGGLFVPFGSIDAETTFTAGGVRDDDSTYRTENWSETIENITEVGAATILGTTIRGSTNSTDSSGTFDDGTAQSGSTSRRVTFLATQAGQTSTTTTAQRTRTTTEESTQTFSLLTTVQTESGSRTFPTTTNITSQTSTYSKSVTQTHSVAIDTITTVGSHLNNVYAATVYQANTRYATDADVIWVADQSAVEDGIAQGAASDYATTTTRTTIYPSSETTVFHVFDKQATSMVEHSNSLESQNLAFVTTKAVATEITRVVYELNFPQITTNEEGFLYVTENTNTENTIFASNSFQAVLTKGATQTGSSVIKLSDTQRGLACGRTFYATTTRTIKEEDASWTTSLITTGSAPAETATYKSLGTPNTTLTATGNPVSFSTQEACGITTILVPAWQATTTNSPLPRIEIERVTGVRTPDNEIAGYYVADEFAYFANSAFVSASRSVVTVRPATFLISDSGFSQVGTASMSSLSGTATTTGLSDDTSTTTSSFTFSLQPEGVGTTSRIGGSNSVVSCGSLGVSQTAFVTIRNGVYKDLSGATISKTAEISSYASGSGTQFLSTVSFFQTAQTQTADKIVWTSPRNVTALP